MSWFPAIGASLMRNTFSLLAATLLGLTASPALADNLSFTLDNQTPNMIVQFYATPADGGTRSELLKKKGVYAGMWSLQELEEKKTLLSQ